MADRQSFGDHRPINFDPKTIRLRCYQIVRQSYFAENYDFLDIVEISVASFHRIAYYWDFADLMLMLVINCDPDMRSYY